MKTTVIYLNTLAFLFNLFFANNINSQGACGGGYTFTYPSPPTTTCNYVFTSTVPGLPAVATIDWRISSTGTFGVLCDYIQNQTNLTYQFCFSGNHTVQMIVNFVGGGFCTVTQTVNVACSWGLVCDPDPNTANIPDPVVEITYISPERTCGPPGSMKAGCMNQTGGPCGANYCVSCGWKWSIVVPVTPYPCEIFTYKLEYVDVDACDNGTTVCITPLTPGQEYCIIAKLDEEIRIVAYGNHCCVPAGYERAWIITPTPASGYSTIGPPATVYGMCTATRCPVSGMCSETQQQMSQAAGIPTLSCLWGGKKRVNAFIGNKGYGVNTSENGLENYQQNMNVEQDVIIYNLQGIPVFNGKWNFGDTKNLYLNWPNIKAGLYLVKFPNQGTEDCIKLFKLN